MSEAGAGRIEYRRPWIYEKQRLAIFDPVDASGAPARYSLIEASTKSGKTAGCMIWLAEQAMQGSSGQNFWWIAPVADQATIVFRRLKRGLPHQLYRANASERTIALLNGAMISFKSADNPDSLYGEDVHAAVIDEASRVKAEAFHAVRSTLTATSGPLRVIGNVKGRKNWFYTMARRAEAGAPGMAFHRIVAADAVAAGIVSAAEIEDAKRQLPEAVYRELFLAEASDDQSNPFGPAAIQACIAPLSDKAPIHWGWDLAKSVDWTVGIALDADGVVCRFERFQQPWAETKARILEATGSVPALVDSTGVGDAVVEDLQRAQPGVFEGFRFSQSSKQQLMEGLAVAIQQCGLRYPDGPIVAELEAFEFEYTRTGVRYAAAAGMHDDCVCALALAVRKRTMPTHTGLLEFYREEGARLLPPDNARFTRL
jgi:phage FluMu gp28-like protein